ncbi:hypothetical protein O181_031994 [Austropuccinia psidii MF-1]|uniref:Uncharacterized protein n=1 Tax=Austropuccinia psidii MF-1 TaxID=1389203 RepID=A0A9Q3H743_9BASI|nr:hypothetical protein [Austropuccinia psidii MF-1]
MVDFRKLREIITRLPFTFQFNRNLKAEGCKDINHMLQLQQLLKRLIPMEIGQQEGQPSCKMGRTWGMLKEDRSQRDTFQRAYENNQRLESQKAARNSGGKGRLSRSKPVRLPGGFTPLTHQKISGQDSPFFTIPASFQEKKRVKVQEKEFFKTEAEIFTTNDSEAVGLSERSTQKPEIILNTFDRISIPTTRNDIPTENAHSFVITESNIRRN